jgi:dihydrofolate reductase
MKQKKIIGLMACDPQGVIGSQGKLPWNYPEELKIFGEHTAGQVMVMGRKTYENTPSRFLDARFNIVFSKKFATPTFVKKNTVFISALAFLEDLPDLSQDKDIFMIGGAEIARLFLQENLLSEFLLTKIRKSFPGDVFFPLELLEGWSFTIEKETPDFIIYHHVK